eukprot:scaffold48468_cov51-Phaeocystis_antarctica.AAC.2
MSSEGVRPFYREKAPFWYNHVIKSHSYRAVANLRSYMTWSVDRISRCPNIVKRSLIKRWMVSGSGGDGQGSRRRFYPKVLTLVATCELIAGAVSSQGCPSRAELFDGPHRPQRPKFGVWYGRTCLKLTQGLELADVY